MDIAALRAQTPGCASRIHLNDAGAALLAQPTIDAMTSHLRLETEIGGYEAADQVREQVAAVYAALAELVGGQAGVNVTTTVPEDNQLDTEIRPVHPLVRFSPHYYNTEAEIDRATQLVAALTG